MENKDLKDLQDLIAKQREYITAICERYNVTKTDIARKSKVAHTTITRLFSPNAVHPLGSTTLGKITKYFNQEPFLFKTGRVVLAGFIGAGGEVTMYSESQIRDEVDAPIEAAEAGAHALEVRGDSMWPVYKNKELVYYVRDCDFDQSFIGHDCVVELENGQVLLKILKRGTGAGLFTLDSYNQPPMEDVRIRWACPVKWTKKF